MVSEDKNTAGNGVTQEWMQLGMGDHWQTINTSVRYSDVVENADMLYSPYDYDTDYADRIEDIIMDNVGLAGSTASSIQVYAFGASGNSDLKVKVALSVDGGSNFTAFHDMGLVAANDWGTYIFTGSFDVTQVNGIVVRFLSDRSLRPNIAPINSFINGVYIIYDYSVPEPPPIPEVSSVPGQSVDFILTPNRKMVQTRQTRVKDKKIILPQEFNNLKTHLERIL